MPLLDELIGGYMGGRITRRELLKRAAALGITVSALTGLLENIPGKLWRPMAEGAPSPRRGGKLVFAAPEDIDIADPYLTSRKATREMLNNMFDPLVRHRIGDPKVYPGLAQSWQVSSDLRSYTFRLRRNVKFHDGTPLNAEAVKFSFDRIASPGSSRGVAQASLGLYDGTKVLDEFTVRIRFKRPFESFLTVAGSEIFCPVSPAAVRRLGKDFGFQPVGTGPFRFKEWVQRSHVAFTRNEDYRWAPAIFRHQGPPYLDEVVWRFVPEPGTRAGIAESGEAQIAEQPSYADLARLQNNPNLKVRKAFPRGSALNVHINVTLPPTDELAVRQAVFFATDKAAIVKTALRGFSEPAHSPIQPTFEEYDPSLKDLYPYNPARAQALLENAGWRVGNDGIRVKGDRRLKVTWDVTAAAEFVEIAPIMQAQLRKVGIDVEVRTVSASVYTEALTGKLPRNLVEIVWWFAHARVLDVMLGSKATFNASRFKNAEFDQLMTKAEATGDPAQHVRVFRQAQRLVLREAALLPVAVNPTLHLLNKSVEGFSVTYLGFPLFYDVFLA